MVGTFSLPVAGSAVTPVRPPSLAMVTSTLAGVAGLPFTRSLLKTSTTPPLATRASGSLLALIVGAVSTTLISAIEVFLVPQSPVISAQ